MSPDTEIQGSVPKIHRIASPDENSPVIRSVLRPSRHGHIYALKMGDVPAIKIGFAADVGKRFASYANSSPLDYRLLVTCPGSLRLELAFHEALKATRIKGEWYRQEAPVQRIMDLMRDEDDLWGQIETHLWRNRAGLWVNERVRIQEQVNAFLVAKGVPI